MQNNLVKIGGYALLGFCLVVFTSQGVFAASVTDYKKCLDDPSNFGHPENCACCVLNSDGDSCGTEIGNCAKPVGVLINNSGINFDGKTIHSASSDCCTVGILVGSVYRGVSQVTIANVNVTNWTNGVVFWNSNNCTLHDSTIDYNKNGLYIYISQDIQVIGNIISNSVSKGVYIESNPSTLQSRFYNNHFHNVDNLYLAHQFWENQWNASDVIPETNIIGGPNIGGNYWTEPSGGGYSELCGCSPDGFCPAYDVRQDAAYISGSKGDNIDFYPLCEFEPYMTINVVGSISGWSLPVGTSIWNNALSLQVITNSNFWTVSVHDDLNNGKPSDSAGKMTAYNPSSSPQYSAPWLKNPIGLRQTGDSSFIFLSQTPQTIALCEGVTCNQEYPLDVQQTVEFGDSVLPSGQEYRVVITFYGVTA